MKIGEILAHVDHTLLKPTATWEQVRTVCDEGVRYRTASVCLAPCHVRAAAEYLNGKLPVCTVIGFPNGDMTTRTKVFETKDALENGADEIDMVINLGWVKEKNDEKVRREIEAVKEACGKHTLKVIVETCLLSEEEKIRMCRAVTEAGADYIKTSTGFSGGGATREDVALFRKYVGDGVKIKAAGGISTVRDAEDFLNLGADRLGTSRLVALAREMAYESL
ncbi:MAG TPA: deoxyribose-phosphate aldolase [Ruminococcaceae bacterium]|nr:deoxyribose-phosphate aldolase [Oscillospiraceae bacterium]